jgi:hypothetical protein
MIVSLNVEKRMKTKFDMETYIEVSDFWKRVRLDVSPDQLLGLENWQDYYGTYILSVIKRSGHEPVLAMVSPTPGCRTIMPVEIIAEDLECAALAFTPGGSLEMAAQNLFPVGPIAMDFLRKHRPRVWLAARRPELKKAWLAFLNELQIAAMKSGGCCEFLSYKEYSNAVARASKACAEGRYSGDAWLFVESMAFENNITFQGGIVR